jgi:hypothetical protein
MPGVYPGPFGLEAGLLMRRIIALDLDQSRDYSLDFDPKPDYSLDYDPRTRRSLGIRDTHVEAHMEVWAYYQL